MPPYSCNVCMFSTKLKTDHKRHLQTKKHIRNLEENTLKTQKDPQKTQKDPQKTQKDPQKNTTLKKHNCDYCDESFSTFAHKRRHELHRCIENNDLNYKTLYRKAEKDKNELYKKMETLLEKVGNTTHIQNNTANIQLNNYGREDMSHITDTVKNSLLKKPYGMIPLMIEAIHFNDAKPENKNIVLPNKNDNKIKIFTGNKWVYKKKDDIINDLVDGKYFIMDTHYDTVSPKLNSQTVSNYVKFKEYFDEGDKELVENMRKECELVLLNNR